MRWPLALLLLLPIAALAQPPTGQPPTGQPPTGQPPTGQAPTGQPPLSPAARAADARRAELDRAFEALRTAPDEVGAALVEARIRSLWAQSASPSVTLLLRRGARNVEAQLPAEALEDFDAAITLQQDFADAWFLRAQAHARAGDSAAAARDLQEALRLEPRHWMALLSLSALQDEAGNAMGALRTLEAALAINPRMPGGQERLREQRRKAEGDVT
jgi:tetratricopeptide (TPR) repeat protein